MPSIEIDFDVYKQLTVLRETETVTYNDVVRKLLKLPSQPHAKAEASTGAPWIVSDTSFPAGSEFIVEYKGELISGLVKDGKLQLSDGRKFTTPSAAAVSVTGSNVNGWRFWKCKLPGATKFVLLERLRGKAH